MHRELVTASLTALAASAIFVALGCGSSQEPPAPEKTKKSSEAYAYCMFWDDETNTCTLTCESSVCEVTEVQSCNCRDSVGQAGNTKVTVCHDTCTLQVTNRYTECVPACGGGGGGSGGPPQACVDRGGLCVPGMDNAGWACCSGLKCNVDWPGGGDGNGVCE